MATAILWILVAATAFAFYLLLVRVFANNDHMQIGEFRCCWRASWSEAAWIKVQKRGRFGWRTVYMTEQNTDFRNLMGALPSELRSHYTDAVKKYIRYRDEWEKEYRTASKKNSDNALRVI